jgi:hypothetical protein
MPCERLSRISARPGPQIQNASPPPRELEQLEVQKAQIDSEPERIDLEAREVTNRALNARAIQEGLGLFEEISENATPEERKELTRFYVSKVIFTPTEVKVGLYTRSGLINSALTRTSAALGAVRAGLFRRERGRTGAEQEPGFFAPQTAL